MTEVVDDNPIIFYCKDCHEIVEVERFSKKYVYKCKKCGTKNVALGTKKSIFGYFKLDEKTMKKEAEEKEKEKEDKEKAKEK